MKREIKFRVWDKKLGTWADWDDFAISCVCPRHDYEGGQYFVSSPPNGALDCYYPEEDDEYVEQQFTGLVDKNGKDIYEGDIVLLREGSVQDGNFSDTKHKCEILVKRLPNSAWFFHARPLPRDDGDRQFSLFGNQYEIVGNIFENPELLNK